MNEETRELERPEGLVEELQLDAANKRGVPTKN